MVMGPPYTYERVLADSDRYAKTTGGGRFILWWEIYLRDEGFQTAYRPFSELYSLPRLGGGGAGLLYMYLTRLRKGHVVAVDEMGVIDPADNAPAHVAIRDYVLMCRPDAVFDQEFLEVTWPRSDSRKSTR
jgi:hypothetical protein